MSIRIVAHRGASATHPENTMAAFSAALESGADVLSFAVQATGDGELVVMNDFDVDRTTSGEGLLISRNVDYVRNLDASSWFDPSQAGEKVPMLAEVFEEFGGQVQFQLELKGFSADYVHAVMESVLTHRVSDDVFTTSAQLPLLLLAQEEHPDTRAGLFAPAYEKWMSKALWQALTVTHVQLMDGESLHAPIGLLDANFVERLHDLDVDVHASDCNNEGTVAAAIDIEVDEISTDDPAMASAVRGDD